MKISSLSPGHILLIIVPYLLVIVFIILYSFTSNELSSLKKEYFDNIKTYEKRIDNLKNYSYEYSENKNNIPRLFPMADFYFQRFKEKGLTDPLKDLMSDLMKQTTLIPYEAKPGGTAGFNEKEMWILNERWVMASVTDGHWSGYLLLEYEISDNREIQWKRIASMR